MTIIFFHVLGIHHFCTTSFADQKTTLESTFVHRNPYFRKTNLQPLAEEGTILSLTLRFSTPNPEPFFVGFWICPGSGGPMGSGGTPVLVKYITRLSVGTPR